MLVCLMVTPVLIKYAERLKLVDEPDERKIHVNLVPRVGGIGMVAGTLFSIAIWLQIDQFVLAYLIGVVVIAIFGTWDDRVQLGHRIKFVGQFIATLVIVFYGGVKVNSLPFIYDGIIPDVITIPFTIFALLGITNAINLTDGLDGLAGGSSLFSLAVIALLGYMYGDVNFVLLCLTVIGAILGFLRFNTHPAIIFMGDTGSQFLGFSLGVLVIWLCQEISPVLSPAIAVIILGLPILDTFYVMTQRLMEGSSPFKPDKRHIHHKLLAAGLEHYEAVSVIYLIQSILVVCAFIFRFQNDFLLLIVYFLSGLLLIALIEHSGKKGLVETHKRRISVFHQFIAKGSERSKIIHGISWLAILSFLIFSALLLYRIQTISVDVLVIAGIVLSECIFTFVVTRSLLNPALLRMELYFLATVLVYVDIQNWSAISSVAHILNGFYVFFFLLTIAGFALPKKDKKHITPLDYIIVFVIILFSFLPEERFYEMSQFSHDVAKLFMLFYLSEFILMARKKDLLVVKTGIMLIFSLLLLKGI